MRIRLLRITTKRRKLEIQLPKSTIRLKKNGMRKPYNLLIRKNHTKANGKGIRDGKQSQMII
jgi:hypothetical protein